MSEFIMLRDKIYSFSHTYHPLLPTQFSQTSNQIPLTIPSIIST